MSRPLSGYRVLDLTLAAAGPWTTMLLGALGAEVFKIEPLDGDIGRQVPPPQRGLSAKHVHCNLNKKGVKLNLKDERDREAAMRLAATADIVIENMRPGTAARLGFGYEQLRRINDRLVYCSISGYGQRGPLEKEGAVDTQIQAFCGWTSIMGEPGTDGQMFRHFAHIDLTTASYAVSTIMMALYARETTGKGQLIELAMIGAGMALQTTRLAEYFATGQAPGPLGSRASLSAPNEAFRCQDGKYIALGIEHDGHWQQLCRALRRDDLAADPRYATNADRLAHREALAATLQEIFLTKAARWWVILGGRFGFPVGPVIVNDFELLIHHPQNALNNHIVELDTHWGPLYVGGPPWSFEQTPVGFTTASLPGEHTRELYELVGMTLEADRTEHFPPVDRGGSGPGRPAPAGARS